MATRVVVVGGDAGGMAAASQARRLRPDLDIVALERGEYTSYSACGIPYLIGGQVDALEDLIARTPEEFRANHRIDVRMGHEAKSIDLDRRDVEVRDHDRNRTFRLGFDHLMLGTGARPRRPDLPGIGGPDIFGVQTLGDAKLLLSHLGRSSVKSVVVVGGGYIGLEMAEAFLNRGVKVTVVEAAPEVMGTLDPDMGAMVSAAMRSMGIDVRCGTPTTGFSPGAVHTESGDIPADLVVLGLGVEPNADLAAEAGIALGAKGAVAVDRRQSTDHDGVWAAGDCAESFHLISGEKVHIALGTVANKAARVAGINIAGGYATFPGVVGTAVSKICATEVARTGLSEREAVAAGFGYHVATIEATSRAGYYPDAEKMTVKMLAEANSGRLLGAQIVGREGAAKRIDVVATALHAGMSVEAMTHLDLSYAPPFSPLWDPVLVASRQAAGLVASGEGRRS